MFKDLKVLKEKEGQASLEYTVMFVIILTVVVLFGTVFQKTLASMFRTQLDTMIEQVDRSNNCCAEGNSTCIEDYRDEFCDDEACSVPVCILVNMDCTTTQLLEGTCN